jgi:hypothetical protein
MQPNHNAFIKAYKDSPKFTGDAAFAKVLGGVGTGDATVTRQPKTEITAHANAQDLFKARDAGPEKAREKNIIAKEASLRFDKIETALQKNAQDHARTVQQMKDLTDILVKMTYGKS